MDNVTILNAEFAGINEYNNRTKPSDLLALISRLHSKFDQLCEQHSVYKLHTIGNTYTIMGYTGWTAKDRRGIDHMIQEGYNVLQVGIQMLEIVNDESKRFPNMHLDKLKMKIGIHTGRIIGGVIGTKIVRYDIFGRDVIIAKKVKQHGEAGSVLVSRHFHDLMKKKPIVWDTFDWQEDKHIRVETVQHSKDLPIKLYKVEPIFDIESDSSEEPPSMRVNKGTNR